MAYDHKAIYKVYTDCVRIDDSKGAFKADGTQITLVQSDIDSARATLDADYAKVKYKVDNLYIHLLKILQMLCTGIVREIRLN